MKNTTDNIRYSNNIHISTINNIYYELLSHMQKAPAEYISFIEYISNYPPNPNMYYTIQNKLIGLKNSITIFPGPQEFFTHVLSQSSNVFEFNVNYNKAYIWQLYNLFYSYFRFYGEIPSPYNRYIANVYKTAKFNPQLNYILMNPSLYFNYINKEIFFYDPIYNDFGLGLDVINMLQRYQEKSRISPSKFGSLLNTLPKIMDSSSFYASAPHCTSNYSFIFSAKGKEFYAYFINDGIKLYSKTDKHVSVKSLFNLDEFTQINCIQYWAYILYEITGGTKQAMDNFSILCSLIMTNYYKNIRYTLPSKNCSPLSLYLVYAPQDQIMLIRYWLENILLPAYNESNYQLKDITKTKNIIELIRKNILLSEYIPVIPSKSKDTEAQVNTINKIIHRKKIEVKDTYGLKHTLINHLPVICFVHDPIQLEKLQSNFKKTRVFTFKPSPSLSKYKRENSKQLSCLLSIYGLKMLYDSNFKNNSGIKWQEQTENVIERFINEFIKLEDGCICYADDLYEIYADYYSSVYGGSPYTRICFIKEFRKLLSNRSWSCQYKKPRKSRSDNRYAFIGISIDEEKVKETAAQAKETNPDTNKTAFIKYLNDMQDTVNEILQSLYNGLYEK